MQCTGVPRGGLSGFNTIDFVIVSAQKYCPSSASVLIKPNFCTENVNNCK